MKRTSILRNVGIAAVIVLAIIAFSYFSDDTRGYTKVDTSVAIEQINAKNVSEAQIDDRSQQLRLTLNDAVETEDDGAQTKIIAKYPSGVSEQIFDSLKEAAPGKFDTNVEQESFFSQMIMFLLPMLILFGLIAFFITRMQGGRGGPFGFGKSTAKQLNKDMPKNTFADVAGADEAVEELDEIKDFLQNPARYDRLGAKIPKGVLLYGPPGTGKTLLARAVAGEAGVPFYSISGSDFVEMFVGVGASRVRDLFKEAKDNSPCIIFVDEIDAVGRQRGAGMGGGNDEREQTLNQLLVEMDGFGDRQGIILIAATNRPDILDPALLRPGRFDRQIPVGAPDLAGRKAILKVHAQGKPIDSSVDMDALSKRTIGMSGADLANVLNEAALLTAREDKDVITIDALEEATDRVVGGPRRKNRVISEHEKKVTAYHEGGHALAAWAMPDIEPVHKVTILARGKTGGHALVVPEDDKSLMTRSEMIARLVMAMGGRAAEEYIFAEPTTGASSDIEQATKIARAMVTEYGMSTRLGAVKYGEEAGDPFLGRTMGQQIPYSHEVAKDIDEEVRKLIEAAHNEAFAILESYRDVLDDLARELLDKETLRQEDLERIFSGVTKRARLAEFNDFGGRLPSTKPPIKTPGEMARERGEPWPPVPVEPPIRTSRPEGDTEGTMDPGSHPGVSAYGPGSDRGAPGGSHIWSAPESRAPQRSVPAGYGMDSDSTRRESRNPVPAYGTPPPPGWSAPGWPPRHVAPYPGGPDPQVLRAPIPHEISASSPAVVPQSGNPIKDEQSPGRHSAPPSRQSDDPEATSWFPPFPGPLADDGDKEADRSGHDPNSDVNDKSRSRHRSDNDDG